MVSISKCPISNLERKLDYDFFWKKSQKQIIILCNIFYFKDNEQITLKGINTYNINLIASDSLVDIKNGNLLTKEQIDSNEFETITEYEYYVNVLGSKAIILPELIESIIHLRDIDGKFNI